MPLNSERSFNRGRHAIKFSLLGLALFSCILPRTWSNDLEAGKGYFDSKCAHCHGTLGEGSSEVKAPRLAGQFYWYTSSQMEAFLAGKRKNQKSAHSGLSAEQIIQVGHYLESLTKK